MINYKTFFQLEPSQFLHIKRLKYHVCNDSSFVPVINTININENKNNSLSIKLNIESKTYLFEIFVSGKMCLKGQMVDICFIKKYLNLLERIIIQNDIIQNRELPEKKILELLDSASYDKIDDN